VKEVLNGISGIAVDLDWKKENKFNALPRHRIHRNCSAVISDETGAIGETKFCYKRSTNCIVPTLLQMF
jgi:hypothetical protein